MQKRKLFAIISSMETNGEYKIESLPKGIRKILSLAFVLILLAAAVLLVYYQVKVNKPASSESRQVNFTVEKGSSTREIAKKLSVEKIIGSENVFIIYSTLRHAGNKIKAGSYLLNQNMAIPEILSILTQGKIVSSEQTVTVIEGWTNKQIGDYLVSRQMVSDEKEFDQSLKDGDFNFTFNDIAKGYDYQGFLFPDSYRMNKGDASDQLIAKMLKNFESKISSQMLTDLEEEKRDLGKTIILASIIEKEVGRNKENLTQQDLKDMQTERELVASVFYNRLKIGMALESDATVNYVTGKSDRSVSIADTKINSPFNTYKFRGLPPTPISNPGLGSIKAAIYPASSDYLFFLNKPDGTAVFAKTLTEHNANKAKYLK